MPQTSVYGFWWEQEGDTPGHSLTDTGSPSGSDVLAEQVESELIRIEGDISVVQSDISALQDRVLGWTRIAEGSASDAFTIDLTVGGQFSLPLPFSMVEVYLRGSLTTGARLNCRVNSDSASGLHGNTYEVRELSDGDVLESASADQTVWTVARWSSFTGCIASMRIYNTDAQALLTHESTGYSHSSDVAARYRTVAQGRLTESRTLESLRFFPSSGGIDTVRWWVQGWRDS